MADRIQKRITKNYEYTHIRNGFRFSLGSKEIYRWIPTKNEKQLPLLGRPLS